MIDSHQTSFHEATVTEFWAHDGELRLKLTGVFTNEGTCNAEILMFGVKRIEIDGVMADRASMPLPDGEVLTLALSHSSLILIVEWNDFVNRSSVTMAYDVCGNSLSSTLYFPQDSS
jgi:hypothetical protein